jgi:hypothetical protein
MTARPGHAPGIGAALTCGHHTHTDRQFLTCLAAAWGVSVEQLCALLLGLLLSRAEEAVTTQAPAPAPAPFSIPAPRTTPAATPPAEATRKPKPQKQRQKQRQAVVRSLLRRNPYAKGKDARAALADAGWNVSQRTAFDDLRAAKAATR